LVRKKPVVEFLPFSKKQPRKTSTVANKEIEKKIKFPGTDSFTFLPKDASRIYTY